MISWQHNNLSFLFDAYSEDGSNFKSSHANSNFAIRKNSNLFRFQAESTVAQGGAITWADAIVIDANADTGIGGSVNPQNKLDVNGGAVVGSSYADTNTAPTDDSRLRAASPCR